MKFTVIWLPAAEDDLTEIWLNAPDRTDINESLNIIESVLKYQADTAGFSLDNGFYIKVQPLSVCYSLSMDDCLETVLQIIRIDKNL